MHWTTAFHSASAAAPVMPALFLYSLTTCGPAVMYVEMCRRASLMPPPVTLQPPVQRFRYSTLLTSNGGDELNCSGGVTTILSRPSPSQVPFGKSVKCFAVAAGSA